MKDVKAMLDLAREISLREWLEAIALAALLALIIIGALIIGG